MVKHFVFLIGLLCVVSSQIINQKAFAADARPEGPVRSVTETVAMAMNFSPELRLAETEISLARGEISIARSGYFPALQVSAGTGFGGDDDYTASLSQLVFDWGATRTNIRRAAVNKSRTESEFEEEKQDIARRAALAHAAVTRDEALVAAAQRNLDAYIVIDQLAEDRLEGGVGDSGERGLAAINLVSARESLVTALNELAVSQQNYERVTGAPAQTLAAPEAFPFPALGLSNLTVLEETAPAVQTAALNGDAAREQAQLQKKRLMPRITVDAFVSADGFNNDTETGIFLRVQSPTFNGLQQVREVQNAKIRAQSFAYEKKREQLDIKRVHERYTVNTPSLKRRKELLAERASNAYQLTDVYKTQFLLSQRSLLDLLTVQNQSFAAEQEQALTDFDLYALQYEAAAALGQLTRLLGVESRPIGADTPLNTHAGATTP